MKWLRKADQYRNVWSAWDVTFAWFPHTCLGRNCTFWLTRMWRRIQLISNYGGSMWISDHECIECASKTEACGE